jgi:YbbR domain-containing protein
VRRFLRRIFNNWPLKLAAVGLATLMYGGLALSQNTQTYLGVISVDVINQPPDTVVLTGPPPVTQIRYFAPTGVPVASSTFIANVNLAGTDGKTGIVSVPIDVTSPDPRIHILGYEPSFAPIELDLLVSKAGIPVTVVHGPVPDGLTLGTTTVDPPTVTISGAQSLVSGVVSARADVIIQPTGIDVDEDVRLVPIDQQGNALRPLEVTPPTARVKIQVSSDSQTRTLPVNPIITGTPAAGFEIESVTVDPPVVLVAGDADTLAQLSSVDTAPIPMTGVSEDEKVTTSLALPSGVVEVGDETISVTITIRPVTGTRTFSAGLQLIGANAELQYALSTDRVLVTIGGSTADLDRLSGAELVVDLDVAGLKPGVHDVPVTANLPAGTTLVAASPATVTVTITELPAASPGTSPGTSSATSPVTSPAASGG